MRPRPNWSMNFQRSRSMASAVGAGCGLTWIIFVMRASNSARTCCTISWELADIGASWWLNEWFQTDYQRERKDADSPQMKRNAPKSINNCQPKFAQIRRARPKIGKLGKP